jgi:hypothetical protein
VATDHLRFMSPGDGEMNTTRLLRRISKYLDANSGGKKQTGETSFGLASCGDAQIVRHLRNGREVGQLIYDKMDRFLTDKGY